MTGSHRSGTSWIGRCLALSGELGFIWEPFSKSYHPPFLVNSPSLWYYQVPTEKSDCWERQVNDLLNFKYRWGSKMRHFNSLFSITKAARDGANLLSHRTRGRRPLFKDPIALMSAAWLEDRFDAQIVVSVRHPAAFVESMKRQRGGHPWNDFIAQRHLLAGDLVAFAPEIDRAQRGELSPIEEHILLWNVLYGFLSEKLEQGRNWIVVKHEALLEDTIAEYRKLYYDLSLSFSAKVERKLISGRRDTTKKWKTRLQPKEIELIRTETENVSSRFYSDKDWI